jgi:hypothetical protein
MYQLPEHLAIYSMLHILLSVVFFKYMFCFYIKACIKLVLLKSPLHINWHILIPIYPG